MISAFAKAYQVLGDKTYLESAERSKPASSEKKIFTIPKRSELYTGAGVKATDTCEADGIQRTITPFSRPGADRSL